MLLFLRSALAVSIGALAGLGCEGPSQSHYGIEPALDWGPGADARYGPPAYGLVGDWFRCVNAKCSRLAGAGARFEPGGSIIRLAMNESDSYCERAEFGQFAADGRGAWIVTVSETFVDCDIFPPSIQIARSGWCSYSRPTVIELELDPEGDEFIVRENEDGAGRGQRLERFARYRLVTPTRSTGACDG
ncbi:MAG: hypothetical protein HY791_16945 [Deltaproteobacteria bacterium]|nr:hypothetical protein [Deltaproteobacteria bacterium]